MLEAPLLPVISSNVVKMAPIIRNGRIWSYAVVSHPGHFIGGVTKCREGLLSESLVSVVCVSYRQKCLG